MEYFLRYEFGGAYIWRGSYMEGLIFGILRYLTLSQSGQPGKRGFHIQFSLCLLYMRPGNEVAGLPRSQLFEPRSREAPTSPPLACEYSRLSSFLSLSRRFTRRVAINWLGDHPRKRKDTTLESEISQFLFKSFHIRSLHKEKQCLFFVLANL